MIPTVYTAVPQAQAQAALQTPLLVEPYVGTSVPGLAHLNTAVQPAVWTAGGAAAQLPAAAGPIVVVPVDMRQGGIPQGPIAAPSVMAPGVVAPTIAPAGFTTTGGVAAFAVDQTALPWRGAILAAGPTPAPAEAAAAAVAPQGRDPPRGGTESSEKAVLHRDRPTPEGGGPVLAITGLRINANIDRIAQHAADMIGGEVVKRLGVWNKNTLMVQLARPVSITSRIPIRMPGLEPGLSIGPSPMDCLDLPTPNHILNARIFVMVPGYDYQGDAEEIAAHEVLKRDWTSNQADRDVYEIRRLIEAAGGKSWVIVPRQPRLVSVLMPQRCHTQLLFRYPSVSAATYALSQIEALEGRINGLRVTVRAEYSKYSKQNAGQ